MSTSVNLTTLIELLKTIPLDTLSAAESDSLVFFREEDKLAYDVYNVLFTQWDTKIFDSIYNSEQTHTNTILIMLERCSVADPVGGIAAGAFLDISLQGLYDTLTAQGSASLIDALLVGTTIEEIDLIDIQNLIDALKGNEDLALVYENLMKESRNHLRAFVQNLEGQNVIYQPQYLSQDRYIVIINSGFKTG